jgi:two-component system sensor histidine kinase RegB
MTPEVLARAGEPFFTTRSAGRGLGLGLFLARVFAERSGGTLTIASGAGTTVTLDLPLAAPEVDAR